MIGATTSQTLDLTLLNKGDMVYGTSTIKVEIGLKIGNTIEYIPVGIYNIDDVDKTDYTIKITAFDNMMKFEKNFITNLGNTLTLQQVVNELVRITGVQFTGTLPAYTVKKLEGFSCREVLSYVASICGGNAVITRDGKFTIVTPKDFNYSIGTSNYFIGDYKREETKYKIGKISCQAGGEVLSKGSLGADSMELEFENPWVTTAILNDIYTKLNGFEYLGYSMKWQGDISLDVGDIVTITDKKGVVRKHPILNQKFTYTGGLTSEIGAKGETKNKNSFSSSGSTTNKVNRLVTEQAVIKEALIEKANISDLKATNAEIANLKAKDVEIENALIKKATIEQLNATNANIKNLIAEDARINTALINKADIIQLNAVNGKINVLESDTANIKSLLAGNISGESGQLIHLTASNVTIADAVIKNLIASKISVADLQAGTISTNKFNISSADGGLSIVGPTMQFKDKSNKVRLQLGQDTSGNFSFILRGTDGTTTLIDHTGIKEKAIADDLIKSNMVATDAIGEKQINYSSLITGLNKDTNTQLIKASKVAIDLTGQSLEVSFNSLKSNVDSIEIGGRNLLVGTLEEKSINVNIPTSFNTFDPYTTYNKKTLRDLGFVENDIVTISFDWRIDKNGSLSEVYGNFRAEWKGINSSGTDNVYLGIIKMPVDAFSPSNTKGKVSITVKLVESVLGAHTVRFRIDNSVIKFIVSNMKLEKGTKATDFTVAPEDTEEKIEANTTSIKAVQGEISALIKDTSIVKGDVTTLKDNYTSIKATVDGINSTVVGHTSSIGKINTDISGLSGKVTTVENKQATLEQNLNGFKTTVSNTYSTKKELTTLDGKVLGLTSRVSTAESSITQLNNKIALKVEATEVNNIVNNAVDGIQIGGRNLAQKTSNEYSNPYSTFTGATNTTVSLGKVLTDGLQVGDDIIVRLIYKYSNVVAATGRTASCWIQGSGNVTEWESAGQFSGCPHKAISGSGEIEFLYTITITEEHLKNSSWSTNIRHDYVQSGSVQWKMFKVEKGTKDTDWTPAPEDVDSAISTVDTKLTTTSNEVASIEVNLSSITQRVSSTESNVTGLTTRVTKAESSITQLSNQITSKVDVNGVKSVIEQNPTNIKVGFNKINNTVEITENYFKFKASDGSDIFKASKDDVLITGTKTKVTDALDILNIGANRIISLENRDYLQVVLKDKVGAYVATPLRIAKTGIEVFGDILGAGGNIGADGQQFNIAYIGSYRNGTNGYCSLPNGKLIQWGYTLVKGGGGTQITFPKQFKDKEPTIVISVMSNTLGSTPQYAWITGWNQYNFYARCTGEWNCKWIAVGEG